MVYFDCKLVGAMDAMGKEVCRKLFPKTLMAGQMSKSRPKPPPKKQDWRLKKGAVSCAILIGIPIFELKLK